MMPPHPLLCHRSACGQAAVYKIAARWSDGVTHELKTYSLSCAGCLAELFRQACGKQRTCRLTKDETLETPSIWELQRGTRDRELVRREDLEAPLLPQT